MRRSLLPQTLIALAFALVLLAAPGVMLNAQEDDAVEPDPAIETPEDEAAEDATDAEADAQAAVDEEEADEEEIEVDDEYYQDVDDRDFRPSEDIPADQSIAFPTDI